MGASLVMLAAVLGVFGAFAGEGLFTPLKLPFESTVVVTGSDVTCSFALKELNEIVKKSTGREFAARGVPAPVREDADGTVMRRIFLGRTAEAEKALGADFFEGGSKYESETSCVFAKDGDLYLVGSDAAGTLWAVYDFVEDNLGYHWYFECRDDQRAESEVFDSCETVVFKGNATHRRPGFDGYRVDHNNLGYFRLFRLRQRSNYEIQRFVPAFRMKYLNRTHGHGFDMYLPRREHKAFFRLPFVPEEIPALVPAFERHPEWFSVDEHGKRSAKMQLCLSSPATRDALWRSLGWWMKKNGKGVYMLGSNDDHTGTYCYCKDCLALDRKYGGQCGALWDCIFDLCGRLKAAKMDGYYITSLAYRHQTQLCPKGITFPDNFVCDFAPVTWDRALSEVADEKLPDGSTYDWLRNCREWCKACPGGVSYWYYGEETNPAFNWGRLSKELREIREAGVRSVGYCGLEGGPEFKDMMHHLFFWALYYPYGDVQSEFNRMCRVKYGPAEKEIGAYAKELSDLRTRVVAATPCGAGAVDPFAFLTEAELSRLQALHDRAAAKAKGTKYAENVAWARISLDVATFFKTGDKAAEDRARAAAASYFAKVDKPRMMRTVDSVTQRLDQMANYANLRSDDLPAELAKYPREKVTRILPAKSAPFSPYGRVVPGKMWSDPDPEAVCGFAISDAIPDSLAPGGADELRIGLRDAGAGRYLIPFHGVRFPKGFFASGKYRMFCLGRSAYAAKMGIIVTDTGGRGFPAYTPLTTEQISRCFDSIVLDRQFETWISVKGQGPKFIPGDTRENRLFIEQVFSVDLTDAEPAVEIPDFCRVTFREPNGAPTLPGFRTGRPEQVMPFGAGNLSAMVSFGTDDLHLHLSRTDYLVPCAKDDGWGRRSLLSPGHVTVRFPGLANLKSFAQAMDVAHGEVTVSLDTSDGPVGISLSGDRATGALVGLIRDGRMRSAAGEVRFDNWRIGCPGTDGRIERKSDGIVFTESDPEAGRRYRTVVRHSAETRGAWRFVVAMDDDAAQTAMAKPEETLRAERLAWWADYWSRGWVVLTGDADAERLTRLWFVNLYSWASVGFGALPPKFNGGAGLVTEDVRGWGSGFWWQNTRELVWPMCAAGHPEFARKTLDFYDACLPRIREKCRFREIGGAYMPEKVDLSMHPFWGGAVPDRQVRAASPYEAPSAERRAAGRREREAIRAHWVSHIYTGTAEYLQQLVEYMRYTGDRSYLPVVSEWMRDWVELYLGILEKGDDGLWHVRCTNVNESWWKVDDSIVDLAAVRYVFTLALAHGPSFGYPENLLACVRERLAGLSAFPTCDELTITPYAETGRMDVRTYRPGSRQWAPHGGLRVGEPKGAYAPNEAYVVFPFGMSMATADDRVRGLATCAALEKEADAIGADGGPLGYWGWDHLPVCLMRLRADNAVEKLMKFVGRTHKWPYGGAKSPDAPMYKGAPVEGVPFFDGSGVLQLAVQEMLLQDAPLEPSTDLSKGGEVRLLPCVPAKWSGSFRLHARGGKIVTCEFAEGKVVRCFYKAIKNDVMLN